MLRTMKQDVKKAIISVLVVDAKTLKAKGKSKAKAKYNSKAQKQPVTTTITQPINGVRKGKVVCFFYGNYSH